MHCFSITPCEAGRGLIRPSNEEGLEGSTLQDPLQVRVRHNCFQQATLSRVGEEGLYG